MQYLNKITLKDGRELLLRNATQSDGEEVYKLFHLVHDESDYLLSYSDESTLDIAGEGEFLRRMEESPNEIMLLAFLDGRLVGTASVGSVGQKYKLRHRASFGISVVKEFWGLGIGTALTRSCIQCARLGGFVQLELEAVADNTRAINMYEKAGFREFGRNPKGFNSRYSGYQELVSMLLEL